VKLDTPSCIVCGLAPVYLQAVKQASLTSEALAANKRAVDFLVIPVLLQTIVYEVGEG